MADSNLCQFVSETPVCKQIRASSVVIAFDDYPNGRLQKPQDWNSAGLRPTDLTNSTRRRKRRQRGTPVHFTRSFRLSEWLLNSGAYMHWMLARPVWYSPRSCTRVEYSNT